MKHALLVMVLLVAVPCLAEDKPRHQGYDILGNLVGTWTIAGQESTYREACDWYPGEKHILCNTEAKRKDGSIAHSMSILGFVPGQGYVYTGIGSGGRYQTYANGTVQDGVIEYREQADGQTIRIRVGPFTNPDIVPFNVHTSSNGTDWTPDESFNYLRVK